MDNPLQKYRKSASFWVVKFKIQLLKIEFFQIISKFMKKREIFFRKNGILSKRSQICSPNFFQTIFRLFATFCTFSEKIWAKRNENRAKSTTPPKNRRFWGGQGVTKSDLREVCGRRYKNSGESDKIHMVKYGIWFVG